MNETLVRCRYDENGQKFQSKNDSRENMSPEDWKHLNDRVRRVDEDRWLSSRYADAPDRNALIALYAFSHELSKIKTTVSEPILGAMRFQWWRDVLEKMREEKQTPAHDVAQAVFATFASDKQLFDRLEHLIDKYQDAFEAKDPSKEPLEYELATACTFVRGSVVTTCRR